MAKDFENRYLSHEDLVPAHLIPTELLQGYIHIDSQKQVRVRINLTDEKAWMCIKYMGLTERNEFEVEMDANEALELYNLCEYKVRKIRRSMKSYGGIKFDFDKYEDGTVIVEVERSFKEQTINTSEFAFIGDNIDGVYKYNNYYYAGFPQKEYK